MILTPAQGGRFGGLTLKAAVIFNGNTGAMVGGKNVASVSGSAGNYTITFSNPLQTATYVYDVWADFRLWNAGGMIQGNPGSYNPFYLYLTSKTTGNCSLRTGQGSGGVFTATPYNSVYLGIYE